MAQRCPHCHTRLNPGVEHCPVCGAFIKSGLDLGGTIKVVFYYSLYILGIALIPIFIAIPDRHPLHVVWEDATADLTKTRPPLRRRVFRWLLLPNHGVEKHNPYQEEAPWTSN